MREPTGYLRYGGVLSPREGDAVGKDKERKREHFWQVVKYTDFFELHFFFFLFCIPPDTSVMEAYYVPVRVTWCDAGNPLDTSVMEVY